MPQRRVSFARWSPRNAGPRSLVSLLLLLAQLVPAFDAAAYTRSETGRWTPRKKWGSPAVHMALLRSGGSPYHSKVLWWLGRGHHEEFFGGVWGWKPGPVDSTYPDTLLVAQPFSPTNAGSPFCAGHSQLADGRLLLAGGTQPGSEFGIRQNVTFDAAADTGSAWQPRDSMEFHRWYPSLTTLADGRALTLSGSHHQHLEFWGGLKNGESTPSDTAVFRYGIGEGGHSDTPIRTFNSPLWPSPRVGHSGVYNSALGSSSAVFGGKLANGTYTDELWELRRQANPTGDDYSFSWGWALPPTKPPGRWRHSAVSLAGDSASLIVIGGIGKDLFDQDECRSDTWRYRFKNNAPRWFQVTITNPSSSDAPGPRADHVTLWHQPSRSLLVFGGRSTPTGNPTDSALYRLEFTSDMTQATWSKLGATGPGPRAATALAYSPSWIHDSHTHAFLFGGEGANGKLNDLWDLSLNAALDTVQWTNRTDSLGGTRPSPRSGHTMIADGGNHWLYVFGGLTPDSSADDTVYKAHLGGHTLVTEESKVWEPYARHTAGALSGHIAVFEDGAIYARKPELYSATNNDWSTINTSLLQEWYPQVFVMRPDTVFVAGPDIVGRRFLLSTGAWSVFPADTTAGFKGGGAVMVRPGKVMKAGSRDTEFSGSSATGTTKSVDLTAGSSAYWRASSNAMAPRVNHNLVLLPNGEVLVVGGTKVINNQVNTSLEPRPELWDPDYGGGAGQWHGLDILEAQPTMRDYHSTALLLPDGRVLCASGNAGAGRDSAEIFCPPYLYSADTLATRPTLLSATGRWRYGADVTFAVSGDTTIRRACLMHPGSTTHGQDMAQRYVPLTLLSSSSGPGSVRQYFVKAPPDSFTAPPGDYLLFVSDAAGVPAVARWVRVGSNTERQYDNGVPDELTFSTTFIYCDEISPIYWTAPGDDGNSGTALDYDIRYSWSPITPQNFPQATPMTSAGIPLLAGTVQTGSGFTGLSPATMLYVAGQTVGKATDASPLAFAEFATLPSCDGGGGYGTSARGAREEGGASTGPGRTAGVTSTTRAFAAPSSQLPSGSTLRLAGEFEESAGNVSWRLVVADFTGDSELLSSTARHALIQTGGASQGWSTQSATPLPGGEVGIRTLPTAGRIVFPEGAGIGSFDLAPHGYACTEALHSRLGDLRGEPDSSLASEFTAGDTLSLGFAPGASSGSGSSLFRVVVPGQARTTSARRPGLAPSGPATADLPTAFALHPGRPNPFSTATTIRFDLPVSERVRIELFDVQGRRVATLLDGPREPGRHSLVWRGLTESGARAPAGVYLCRMTAGAFRAERRVTLLP